MFPNPLCNHVGPHRIRHGGKGARELPPDSLQELGAPGSRQESSSLHHHGRRCAHTLALVGCGASFPRIVLTLVLGLALSLL